jgi:hypothetical protein
VTAPTTAPTPAPAPATAPIHARVPAEEAPVLRTVSDLLEVIERLPAADRDAARDRIDAALAGDARTCRVALGVLALDLAEPAAAPVPRELEVHVDLVHLDRLPATATV